MHIHLYMWAQEDYWSEILQYFDQVWFDESTQPVILQYFDQLCRTVWWLNPTHGRNSSLINELHCLLRVHRVKWIWKNLKTPKSQIFTQSSYCINIFIFRFLPWHIAGINTFLFCVYIPVNGTGIGAVVIECFLFISLQCCCCCCFCCCCCTAEAWQGWVVLLMVGDKNRLNSGLETVLVLLGVIDSLPWRDQGLFSSKSGSGPDGALIVSFGQFFQLYRMLSSKNFQQLWSRGNSGGVFWTVFQLCPIWSSIFFQLWSRGNSGGAASGCWCNFSAPTIIICTKAVPSAQFSNTKNGPLSAFKLGFRGKFEENETKMFEEKK